MDSFVKRLPHPHPDKIRWEVLGLAWLARARAVPIVEVFDHDERALRERRLITVPPTRQAAEEFGRLLARMHAAGARAFGTGPDGWPQERPGWIGEADLPLGQYSHWGQFYAEARVAPYVRRAREAGLFAAGDSKTFDRLCERLTAGDFDDDLPPARLHGDLWAGNALYTADGVTLIDPAAHGGHPLTDLAMLELFGFAHLEAVWRGYSAEQPAARHWHQLVALHQVHPLLVHTVLFGAGYADQALGAARIFAG
ncbi:Fructosamine-3-kinase [Propionibacterium cyclohexanicum]|uniref:Fructosamine-3-kinase n=1 Tax=Propionibacterium cyclohexanicum TaxID=64702 RepID=A0A1H9TF34_9ACTN|nr:fructosamine kinase family protein [Propionibacterium cyclohexanicum]SER95584.1 Fructosamine-3-kinase [Propionibacterium cyclohexanicum]